MRLFLMRHADAEQAINKKDDERELTLKGEKETHHAADFLANFQIDKAIVSYVTRAQQTAKPILETVLIAEIDIVTELYRSSEEKIIEFLANQMKKHKNILVVGHNPVIYKVATILAEYDNDLYEYLVNTGMPTARIIIIDFDTDNWPAIKEIKGKITKIFTP